MKFIFLKLLKSKKELISSLVLIIFIGLVLVFALWSANRTVAWFANNKNVTAEGMSVRSKDKDYELITLSSDAANKNGVYFDPYHAAVLGTDGDGYEIWLVDSDSNIGNYSSTGNETYSNGLEPGSNGVIKFYIKPYKDITLSFSFQTVGYTSEPATIGGQETVVMTELTSNSGDPACFLNGHILLFEGKGATYYTGLIPAGNDGNRVFTREFIHNGAYDADTDGDDVDDAYEVDIYWVWPKTLDTLVKNAGSNSTLICDKNAVVPEGETNDYYKVVNNICAYPEYYLERHGHDDVVFTEQNLSGRDEFYNDADQSIGMNVEYVMLRLDAIQITGD